MSVKQAKSKKLSPRLVLTVILAIIFLVSAVMVAVNLIRSAKETAEFDSLADSLPVRTPIVTAPATVPDEPQTPETPTAAEPETPGEQEPEAPAEPEVPEFHRYDDLYAQNQELFGWIEIPGTVINYPVMFTPDDPEKYLHTSFEGKYSFSGVPFMDANCFVGCGNYLLYGHDMKNKTMFAQILDYKNQSFWEDHQTVYFDLVTEPGEYQVVAAFYDKVHRKDEVNVFKYYQCTDLTTEEQFNYYVTNVKALALYDTGIDVTYGDTLLTLSTCSYQTDNGRFVVVAKKVA